MEFSWKFKACLVTNQAVYHYHFLSAIFANSLIMGYNQKVCPNSSRNLKKLM
jgi:hypothetical protein